MKKKKRRSSEGTPPSTEKRRRKDARKPSTGGKPRAAGSMFDILENTRGGKSSGAPRQKKTSASSMKTKQKKKKKNKKKREKKGESPLTAYASDSAEMLSLEAKSNPFLEEFEAVVAKFPDDMDLLVDPQLKGGDLRRALLFDLLPDEMPEKYAWAVADERALKAIAAFGPVIEIACGGGYWGKLLIDRGVDWVGYDMRDLKTAWTNVRRGGPEVLKGRGGDAGEENRSLMLCYPDDFEVSMESVALKCLENYTGDIVIHIGENFPNTHQENPWGRSTSSDFQLELAHGFHKILQLPLPSWPMSVDCLTVWKRSDRTNIDDMQLRHIPRDERIDVVQCAPCTKHLV